ncbi:hypothetical protein [Mycolicibacterium iranicum]|uniref:Uncharacterized protein n=1 Tax=Mycolicibacterium iranicum TaxID=912594 RepID=A0A1X1WIC5_MYCIR|nr:hypothetical protein [Mycolicibacterium iranicum]ORV86361.1 hypothetical protein AWC12_18910 [Mycolicibacterium iranicum]
MILGTLWPLQSESAWHGFASAIKSEAIRLFQEDGAQQDILRLVATTDQAGAFIEAATRLVRVSTATLESRYRTYSDASTVAERVATRIWAIKLRMAESVDAAETAITAAKNELEPQIDAATAALDGIRASQLTAELEGRITAAITQAQTEVTGEAATGAAEIAALNTKLGGTEATGTGEASPLNWGNGAELPSAPAMPAPSTPGGSGIQSANYDTFKEGTEPLSDRMPGTRQADEPTLSRAAQDSNRFPEEVKARDADTAGSHGEPGRAGTSGVPPAASAPSTGGGSSSGAGSPASVFGSAMRPMSSSAGSPASSGAPASSGSPSGVSGTGTPAAQPGSGASSGAGNGTATSSVGRALSGASTGAGIAETSARMGTGAVAATANALNTAGNVGPQIAQSATNAPQPASPPPPGPVGTAAPAGSAPLAMLPPTSAPAAPVAGGLPPAPSPAAAAASAGPGIPGTPQQGPAATAHLGGASPGGPGANAAPVMMPMSQVRTVGVDGATGDVLFGQAADAARSILETVIAQTRHAGYGSSQGFVWAVTVIAERTGGVTAWLATSEGPSYIPRGVRVPDDVRLAVTDPVVGRQLWDDAAAAGGADPLNVLARHAELRDSAAPGGRVLAFAASVPMARVMDWAATVGARAVSVDPRTIGAAAAVGDEGQHRCAAVMPWEWQQASMFSEQQRLQVAVRHMLMAANAGHLTDPACERVMEAFDRGNPVTASDWADVRQAFAMACVNYEMTRAGTPLGGESTTLERVFRTARAAEVVWCAREYASAEGCADLLYASRLAGAPLNPAAAVA